MKILKLSVLFVPAFIVSHTVNAATNYGSGIVPYNGTYNNQTNISCDLDSSYLPPAIPSINSINHSLTGQETFTPDITHTSKISSLDAFTTKWVPYITGLSKFTPAITNPISLLTATPDPTSPADKLSETPIQWGSYSLQTFDSKLTGPSSGVDVLKMISRVGYVFITTFTYKVPPATNPKIGYAAYVYSTNDSDSSWQRYVVYSSPFTATSASLNIVSVRTSTQQFTIDTTPFNFNCVENNIHIR